jgi:hypothetical protein
MDIPQKFTIKDDGKYGHDKLFWICRPKSIVQCRTDSDYQLIITYNDDYIIDSVISRSMGNIKRESVNNPLFQMITKFDPRHIVKNHKITDLSKFGLDSGYIVSGDGVYTQKIVILKEYMTWSSHLLVNNGNGWKINPLQTWDYRMVDI